MLVLLSETPMSTQPKIFLTPEEYLAIEREAEFRSEYWNGEMYAMAGATEPHNDICRNVSGLLWLQIRSRPCKNWANDMRVRTSSNLYTYPDEVVVFGGRKFLDERHDTLLNPGLIVRSAITPYRALRPWIKVRTVPWDRIAPRVSHAGIRSYSRGTIHQTAQRQMESF